MEFENREFKVLNDIEHVLCRPNMYIGGISLINKEQWILNNETNKFYYGNVSIVPAILKCCSELLDNSIDVAIDTNFKYANIIKVNITDTSIEVIDNGIGIPCRPPDGSTDNSPNGTCACLAWTTLKSGTSFSENRNKIGTNGVGSSCVNIFSKKFIGQSDDGKHSQTISCFNNLSEIQASKVKKSSGKSGVTVYCEPDLERFGVEKIDDLHKSLVYQRLINLAISFPKITFYFNNEKIKVSNKNFSSYFSEFAETIVTDNATICVFPNEYDEFKHYSFVNGIDTFRGGAHVDYISSEICSRIKDKLVKKYKTIRPGDIKNKLSLVVFLTNFNNPEFDAQTKESLSNSPSHISKHLNGKVNFDTFVKTILKNEEIINPIIETFKIKEELKARTELKKNKKVKVKTDKYMSPFGKKKYFLICEGLSARGGLSSALGRNGFGYFAARGVPINGYDAKIQALIANQELKDIINILELDFFNKDNPNKTIAFDKIVLANDSDLDGIFICSQYIGWFTKYAPNLFKEHKIARLITPLAVLRDNKDKITKVFYSLTEFKEYEKTHDLSKIKVEYKKGLGSWQQEDFINLFETHGFEYFLQDLELDENGQVYVDDWLNTNKADKRKEYLREFTLDTELL